jgi:hypothetical protein
MTIKNRELLIILIFSLTSLLTEGCSIFRKPYSSKEHSLPLIRVKSISFNHDSECSSCDAINLRKNYHEDVHVPEWKNGERPYPAAYIKNRCVTIKAVFTAKPWVKEAVILAEKSAGELGDIKKQTVFFKNRKSKPVNFRVSGKTPLAIKMFDQEWQWYYMAVNGAVIEKQRFGITRNKIYIILEEPQSPWTTSGQTEPWTDVLDKSCIWAQGATNHAGAAEIITKALYKKVGALYDVRSGRSRYTLSRKKGPFALTNFLGNIPNVGVVNCYDMGKALVSFSNVLGCGLSYKLCGSFGYVNCIKPIGRHWTNNPFHNLEGRNPRWIVDKDSDARSKRSLFGKHAFAGISENIFDASFMVDVDSIPDEPPHTESWMINLPQEFYRARVVDKYPHWPTDTFWNYKFSIY